MDSLLNSVELQSVRVNALRRLKRNTKAPLKELDVDLVDALARELFIENKVPDNLRAALLPQMVQLSPGGMMALSWQCMNEDSTKDIVLSIASKMPQGAPLPNALNEEEAWAVVRGIESSVNNMKYARTGVCIMLLASPYFTEAARAGVLARLLRFGGWTVNDRRTILAWAMGLQVGDKISGKEFPCPIPDAPKHLARNAINGLIIINEDLNRFIRNVLDGIANWEEPKYILQGILDLVSKTDIDILPALRKQAADICIKQPDPSLRRRAYGMACSIDREHYLQLALRDPDFTVRNWALSMLKN